MGKTSKVPWSTSSFACWSGCAKVSDGCTNCWAEAMMERLRPASHLWNENRWITSESNWAKPLLWNKQAMNTIKPWRVFCNPLGDVFEDHPDLIGPRKRLEQLIMATPYLTWMILTKRPENVDKMVSKKLWASGNAWLGVTVENQEMADKRLPLLVNSTAAVRFVSQEPALGPVDYKDYIWNIDYVIMGCETGPHARPMDEAWVRWTRDQCVSSDTPFFYKSKLVGGKKIEMPTLDGRVWNQYPDDLSSMDMVTEDRKGEDYG